MCGGGSDSSRAVLFGSCPGPFAASTEALDTVSAFKQYFGTTTSASSYGGYGGNANKRDTTEYVYDMLEGWKERLISKVEKGKNGTDNESYNPSNAAEAGKKISKISGRSLYHTTTTTRAVGEDKACFHHFNKGERLCYHTYILGTLEYFEHMHFLSDKKYFLNCMHYVLDIRMHHIYCTTKMLLTCMQSSYYESEMYAKSSYVPTMRGLDIAVNMIVRPSSRTVTICTQEMYVIPSIEASTITYATLPQPTIKSSINHNHNKEEERSTLTTIWQAQTIINKFQICVEKKILQNDNKTNLWICV